MFSAHLLTFFPKPDRTKYRVHQSEVCHVVPISSIKLKSTTTPPFTYPFSSSATESPLPGTDPVELPTCPVCLELLDSRVTGLVQIMCQHNYHCQCLLKWGDSRSVRCAPLSPFR